MNKIYACYPGGKHKALTMSYDDGRTQDRRLVEIFNRYGIRGTFHLNSGLFGDERRVQPSEVKTLYEGHEVSCHTVTHPTIARCPLPEVAQEVLEDRRALESLVGYPVRGLSYPNGSFSDDIVKLLPALGIRYARTVESTGTFALPEDPLRWGATCHHNRNLMELGDQFLALFKTQYLYLMYVWGHSYEFDDRDNWDLIEGFCEKMGGKDDIWYCTNIEFVDAMEAVRALQFSCDNSFVYNPSASDCWIRVNDGEPVCLKGGTLTQL
ncbi:MAG: polysaccharide deacetylase family protein [Clostridia bacterium]|nr:polysaccharide deacetylase family protein [Clostridia bacterium]MBR1686403.1 polysaccharide deacetylase family protein [Clostridia bacterium]MBR2288417.1 polysaccharide deacetylase family protein [Clostridia bacterium]